MSTLGLNGQFDLPLSFAAIAVFFNKQINRSTNRPSGCN